MNFWEAPERDYVRVDESGGGVKKLTHGWEGRKPEEGEQRIVNGE